MNSKMKRTLSGVLAVALVGGVAAGGIYWKQKNGSKPVEVYEVSNFSTTYWGDNNESYGNVITDQTQAVYLSSTQLVKKIMVTPGQNVQKGDVLMTYDTTLSEVEVEQKKLSIQQMELDLKKAKDNLAKVNRYRPGVPISDKDLVMPGGFSLMNDADDGMTAVAQADSSDAMMAAPGMTVLTGSGWRIVRTAALMGLNQGDSETEPETEPASTEAEETEAPETEPATTEPEETKPQETKPQETKPQETKPVETKPQETKVPKEYPVKIGGKGSEKKPLEYSWKKKTCSFNQELLEYLADGRKTAWVKLQMDQSENWWLICIEKKDKEYTFQMVQMSVDGIIWDLRPEKATEPEEPTEPEDPDPYIPDPGPTGTTYTAAEIAALKTEINEKIRDLDLDIRMAKVEYTRLEKELNNGAVLSTIDGVVTEVRDEEDAKINNQPVIDVSGGGGYYVKGTVSELKLEELQVGQPVTVMSSETGMVYDGEVKEIMDYPSSNGWWGGDGNTNVSYYDYTVFIDESADLKEGEFVNMSYTLGGEEGGNRFYVEQSMIRSANGTSYVYVANEEGLLERRDIRTGRALWGSYLEIISGLSQEDKIAFPYGKNLKEGAPTVEGTLDSLYGW